MNFFLAKNSAFFSWYYCSIASFATPTWYYIFELRFSNKLSYSLIFYFNDLYYFLYSSCTRFLSIYRFFFVYSTVLVFISKTSIFWRNVLWLPFTFSSSTLFLFIISSSSNLSLFLKWSNFLPYSSDIFLEYSSNFFLHYWLTFTFILWASNYLNLSMSL